MDERDARRESARARHAMAAQPRCRRSRGSYRPGSAISRARASGSNGVRALDHEVVQRDRGNHHLAVIACPRPPAVRRRRRTGAPAVVVDPRRPAKSPRPRARRADRHVAHQLGSPGVDLLVGLLVEALPIFAAVVERPVAVIGRDYSHPSLGLSGARSVPCRYAPMARSTVRHHIRWCLCRRAVRAG